MMKTILSTLAAAVLLLSVLSGCGSKDTSDATTPAPAATAQATQSPMPTDGTADGVIDADEDAENGVTGAAEDAADGVIDAGEDVVDGAANAGEDVADGAADAADDLTDGGDSTDTQRQAGTMD